MSAKAWTAFKLAEESANTAALGQDNIPEALLQDVNC
jgi:hypothetical protein